MLQITILSIIFSYVLNGCSENIDKCNQRVASKRGGGNNDIGYVNINTIIMNMPEYKKLVEKKKKDKQKLADQVSQTQNEIREKGNKIKNLQDFSKESQEEINTKSKELEQEYNKKIILIKTKIKETIIKINDSKFGFKLIFDISVNPNNIFYYDKNKDITQKIIDELNNI